MFESVIFQLLFLNDFITTVEKLLIFSTDYQRRHFYQNSIIQFEFQDAYV